MADLDLRFPGKFIEYEDKIKIPRLNILLFVATFLTTYLVNGIFYSISIMTILLAHELGHYFACRKYRVPATVPFFIPVPLPPFGTFGAVIKMKGIIPNRKALFDIGVAGPIIGLLFTIPVIIIGLKLSTVIAVGSGPAGSISLGESILFKFLSKIVIGDLPPTSDVILHPIAYAGWAGLFVTALNLIPIGQLDGGHVIYSILGKKSKFVFWIGLSVLTFITIFINQGWLFLLILIIIFGRKHPQTFDDETPLDSQRILIGILMIIIFLLSFTPVPIKINM